MQRLDYNFEMGSEKYISHMLTFTTMAKNKKSITFERIISAIILFSICVLSLYVLDTGDNPGF